MRFRRYTKRIPRPNGNRARRNERPRHTERRSRTAPIDPAGEAFDALEHQAVGQVEDASVPDETVAQVYQKGYRLGKKVIRPAMVTISTGGPKREVESDDAE